MRIDDIRDSSELPKSTLFELNDVNNASVITYKIANTAMSVFPNEGLVGVQMGIAYGGGVERMAELWKDAGVVYGFDTFTGHPKQLAQDPNNREAVCMDIWYQADMYGTDKLDLKYQEKILQEKGLTNAFLIKGLVTEDSCKDIPRIHYAFLDMDIVASMDAGYKAVKDKIAPGGYLLLHDVVSPTNIPPLWYWFRNEVLYKDFDMWYIHGMYPELDLAILRRRDFTK